MYRFNYKELNEEVSEIAVKAAKDEKYKIILLNKLTGYLKYLIKKLKYKYSDDYLQEAYIGVLKSLNSYREGESFLYWIQLRIRRQLIEARSLEVGLKKCCLRHKNNNENSIKKIDNFVNIISLNKKVGFGSGMEMLNLLFFNQDTELEVSKKMMMEDIEKSVQKLSKKEAIIFENYHYENKNLAGCGKRYGITAERVRQILKNIYKKIRISMKDLGYNSRGDLYNIEKKYFMGGK